MVDCTILMEILPTCNGLENTITIAVILLSFSTLLFSCKFSILFVVERLKIRSICLKGLWGVGCSVLLSCLLLACRCLLLVLEGDSFKFMNMEGLMLFNGC